MKKHMAFLLLWLSGTAGQLALGQNARGSISGTVVDAGSAVLQGARVELDPGGSATVSDNQGEFRFRKCLAWQLLLSG